MRYMFAVMMLLSVSVPAFAQRTTARTGWRTEAKEDDTPVYRFVRKEGEALYASDYREKDKGFYDLTLFYDGRPYRLAAKRVTEIEELTKSEVDRRMRVAEPPVVSPAPPPDDPPVATPPTPTPVVVEAEPVFDSPAAAPTVERVAQPIAVSTPSTPARVTYRTSVRTVPRRIAPEPIPWTPSPAVSTYAGSGPSGQVMHTGPRGGRYYINSNGNKTYPRKK